MLKAWIHAARLRTLPLASASILLGSSLAASEGDMLWPVTLLALLTALLLQILSNLANDYGDAVSGVDDHTRVGPERALQAGLITQPQMRRAIVFTTVLSCISGLGLLTIALGKDWEAWLSFMLLGALAVVAAMTYTMGKRPYGYYGLGDLSVFLFFGALGVVGCAYLHLLTVPEGAWLLAAANGFLATAVLNINNLRDLEPDKAAGKHTFAVRLGPTCARRYHLALVLGGLLAYAAYLLLHEPRSLAWAFLLPAIPALKVAKVVITSHDPVVLDSQLKQTAKFSFILALFFSLLLPHTF